MGKRSDRDYHHKLLGRKRSSQADVVWGLAASSLAIFSAKYALSLRLAQLDDIDVKL